MPRTLSVSGIRRHQRTFQTEAALYRAITTIIILTLWAAQVVAQPTYFDNFYGVDTMAGGVNTGGTVRFQSGYFSWSAQKDAGVSFWRPYGFEIDTFGFLTNEFNPYTEDTISERTANVLVVEDSLLVGLSYQRVLTQQIPGDVVLTKMNGIGETIWREVYGFPDRLEIPQRAAMTTDGGFILIGQITIETQNDQEADVWLIKTDDNGVVQWEQTYGGVTYDSGSDVVQTSDDGGFLLLGWTRSFGAGQRDFYLMKTDSLGNLQWQRTYGGGGDEIGLGILLLSDGNYLLTGAGSLGSFSSIGRIYKVTPNGTVVWSKTYAYENNTGHGLYRTVEMWNGDLVSVGMTNLNSNAGYLVRTDSEGEVIWQREYDKNEYTDLFYSVLATSDGGFLLSGQAVNEETNNQDAWLLKVDSIGCPYPNCTVGIDEQERTVMVDVWPNPCTDVLRFEVQGSTLDGLQIDVMDMNGRMVAHAEPRALNFELDAHTWSNGIYVVRGTDKKGRSFSVKVIKQ